MPHIKQVMEMEGEIDIIEQDLILLEQEALEECKLLQQYQQRLKDLSARYTHLNVQEKRCAKDTR